MDTRELVHYKMRNPLLGGGDCELVRDNWKALLEHVEMPNVGSMVKISAHELHKAVW